MSCRPTPLDGPIVVQLTFNPETSQDEDLRAVWADREARTWWLLWRRGHIVNQHFAAECLRVAEAVRASSTLEELRSQLADFALAADNFTQSDLDTFLPVHWPYLRGDGVRWEIVTSLNPRP